MIGDIRIIPYPPSFNNTAAKIILPSNGASTWALGNHRWDRNNGSLIRKAKIRIIYKLKDGLDKKKVENEDWGRSIKIPINKGRDPKIV